MVREIKSSKLLDQLKGEPIEKNTIFITIAY